MRHSRLRVFVTTLFTVTSISLLFPPKSLAVIQSINGQTGQTQTFQNDTNVTISSSNNVHSLGWQGYLSLSRGGTGAGSFANGSIPFIWNGIFAENNSNLYWDNTNKRLGIGTSSPTSTLDVNGNTTVTGNLNVSGTITTINLIPYSGATGNVDLGDHRLILGVPNGNGIVQGADSSDNPYQAGGALNLVGGVGKGGGQGGAVTVGGGGGFFGGSVYIKGGQGLINDGGDVLFYTGASTGTGSSGKFKFLDYGQTSTFGILDFTSLSSADKTFIFPNASGTFGLLQSDQIWSGLNSFEASTNSTIYIGSPVKSGCIVMGDSDGNGLTYITAYRGVLSASTTRPDICQ